MVSINEIDTLFIQMNCDNANTEYAQKDTFLVDNFYNLLIFV